ncbi:MAG TPA: Hsp20/alpha crystallin family protein [Planctomycetota bacterium]|nr:Hsp20/alpha crystallin family protein [Planctomycetota bacterium]
MPVTTEAKPLVQNQPAAYTSECAATRKVFMPRADIFETAENFVIIADMPGVDEKSVDITLEKNVLTIHGKVESLAPEGYEAAYKEYEEGDYERAFTLTDAVDREGIQALVKNGVLRLTLPKAGPAKARKIEVKTT